MRVAARQSGSCTEAGHQQLHVLAQQAVQLLHLLNSPPVRAEATLLSSHCWELHVISGQQGLQWPHPQACCWWAVLGASCCMPAPPCTAAGAPFGSTIGACPGACGSSGARRLRRCWLLRLQPRWAAHTAGTTTAADLACRSSVDCSGRSWCPGRSVLGLYTYLRRRLERRGGACAACPPACHITSRRTRVAVPVRQCTTEGCRAGGYLRCLAAHPRSSYP